VFEGLLPKEVVSQLNQELKGFARQPHELIPQLEVSLFHATESHQVIQSTQCSNAPRDREPAPPIVRKLRKYMLSHTAVGEGALAKIELVTCLAEFEGVAHHDN
jgi:hypothetical protein